MANPRELAEQAFTLLQDALRDSEARASDLDEQLKRKRAPKTKLEEQLDVLTHRLEAVEAERTRWQQAGEPSRGSRRGRAHEGRSAAQEARGGRVRPREAHEEGSELLARESGGVHRRDARVPRPARGVAPRDHRARRADREAARRANAGRRGSTGVAAPRWKRAAPRPSRLPSTRRNREPARAARRARAPGRTSSSPSSPRRATRSTTPSPSIRSRSRRGSRRCRARSLRSTKR